MKNEEEQKQDAVNTLMQKLGQLTTDLIDNAECAFIECLQNCDLDPVENVDYVNEETAKWLRDVSNRAFNQHQFRLSMRKFKRMAV